MPQGKLYYYSEMNSFKNIVVFYIETIYFKLNF